MMDIDPTKNEDLLVWGKNTKFSYMHIIRAEMYTKFLVFYCIEVHIYAPEIYAKNTLHQNTLSTLYQNTNTLY